MLVLIFFITLGVFVATQEPPFVQENQNNKNEFNGIGSLASKTMIARYNSNAPFIDKDENMVRFPVINDHKKKKKLKKLSPKRTIQKIIKKKKVKQEKRRVYYKSQRTNKPTTKMDYDKFYGSEEKNNHERTTMQTQKLRKRARARKFSNKVSRYHMPFQSLQGKGTRRHNRDLSRELYILKDLDEMQFMKGEKDYDVVKAHVKKPW